MKTKVLTYFNQKQIGDLRQKSLTKKIAVIKIIAKTGCGLREAKGFADMLQAEAKAELTLQGKHIEKPDSDGE